jgi:hypothetical protein
MADTGAGSISINDASITEGNAGTKTLTFTVIRTGGSAAFDVDFSTVDGTATIADGDYVKNAGTLHFADGINTQTVSVVINGDTKVEPNETFGVQLSNATNGATISKAQGTGTIIDDDGAAAPGSISINDASIVEGNAGTQILTFTAIRSGGSGAFDVSFSTVDGTATVADNDYVKNAGTLHFADGVNTQTISVVINGDTKVEPNETFTVQLSNATNGATITKTQGTGAIINDDGAATPGSISINDASIVEGNAGTQILTFTVIRTGGSAAFDVSFSTVDGTATVADNDYVKNAGTLHFADGVNTQTISVVINGDTKVEPNETFTVQLSNATNGATTTKTEGTGTIINDDTATGTHFSPTVIQKDYLAITRTALSIEQATSVASAIDAGTQTETKYVSGLLSQVESTTIPAVAVEASMYGVTGTSAEITKLVTQFLPGQIANATHYGFNPLVYASEALGLTFAFGDENGGTAFAGKCGPSTAMPNSAAGDAAFAAAAAKAIFGDAATANTPGAILAWETSWKAFFSSHGIAGNAHPTADQIDLAARGAAWRDAVGTALANDLGPLHGQVINFLDDAAQGTAVYSASLAGQPAHAPFQGATLAGGVQLVGVGAADHATF